MGEAAVSCDQSGAAREPSASEQVARAAIKIALEPDFDFAGSAYADLFEASNATAFQHPVWLQAFYSRLARERGAEPFVATGRETATGRLLFVLPMIRRTMAGVALVEAADLGVSDYAAPVIRDGWVGEDLRNDVSSSLPAFDLLRIKPVTTETVPLWMRFFRARSQELDFSSHAVELAALFPKWRAKALDASFARSLDRKKKRFFKTPGAELTLLKNPGEISEAVEAIRSLRAGRFEGDLIQQDFVRDFYAQVAVAGAGQEFARTYRLSLGAEPIGYVFGLTCRGRFYYLLIGCDYEAHGRHSPGLLMYDGIIEDWMRDGGAVFDFTIGDEPFKRDFGTSATAMHALVGAPTWRGKLALAAFEARGKLRRMRRGAAKD